MISRSLLKRPIHNVLVCTLITICRLAHAESNCEWTGDGNYRILIEVSPEKLENRKTDESPASLEINFSKELTRLGLNQTPDLSSLQVIQYDPETGKPIIGSQFSHGQNQYDAPFRWYDSSIPYDFPEFANSIDRTKGTIKRSIVKRGGYFYDAIGDWKKGSLAWLHTQHENKPSFYAVYFDLLPAGQKPDAVPPRAWIGDGLPRCAPVGTNSMGADHCRIDLDDWDNDGLVDIIVGEQYGHLFWWPNTGTRKNPKFPYMKFIKNHKGIPLDSGSAATPKIVDWNGDGIKDLLVGAEWNRILLYLNEGTNSERKLRYAGLLQIDGKDLMLPIRPLVRGEEKIFKRDYYPVLETVDWDADGDIDLLAGGYITGRIYFYENQGPGKDQLPQLIFRGPLEADGNPLNVKHWCASPCIADFDGDGDLDLMTGNMPMYERGGDGAPDGNFLQYFENVGSRKSPKLKATKFPKKGNFPSARLATPRSHDWDDDGDLDLVVSARSDLYLFENEGNSKQPNFHVHSKPLTGSWGASRIPGDQFVDENEDGLPDLFKRGSYTIRHNTGKGSPWSWGEPIRLLPPGKQISHPSGIGDDWYWPYLNDLDQDGRRDILFGDWSGHIWFHRNLRENPEDESGNSSLFDWEGKKLKLINGELLKVGPVNKDIKSDFDALQGARTVFSVSDINRDGHPDLIVGDTYGIVRYFENSGQTDPEVQLPRFNLPVELGNLGLRLLVDTGDWNQDGWPDVIAGSANGRVRVFLNRGQKEGMPFEEGFDPGLPKIPQPRSMLVDMNGDGDQDIYLPSTQGSCLVERSFLENGYAKGKILRVEKKK